MKKKKDINRLAEVFNNHPGIIIDKDGVRNCTEEDNKAFRKAYKEGNVTTLDEIFSKIDWKSIHEQRVKDWGTNEEISERLDKWLKSQPEDATDLNKLIPTMRQFAKEDIKRTME